MQVFGEICTFKQDSALQTGQVKQSNHFACNFANYFKISFTVKQNDNYSVVKQDHHALNV